MAIYTAKYKGHEICVKAVSHQSGKLVVDGKIQDEANYVRDSGLGDHLLLLGRIKDGDGCGENIRVRIFSGVLRGIVRMYVDEVMIPCAKS